MAATIRMLLSHNFMLAADQVSPLSRQDFANVFINGLKPYTDIQCSPIDNPHWVVEVLFDSQQKSPTDVAALCAQSLSDQRLEEPNKHIEHYTIMLLGGVKTTPVRGTSPTALQPGEWGVDVVETATPEQFLVSINWEAMTAGKPAEQIFKVTHIVE